MTTGEGDNSTAMWQSYVTTEKVATALFAFHMFTCQRERQADSGERFILCFQMKTLGRFWILHRASVETSTVCKYSTNGSRLMAGMVYFNLCKLLWNILNSCNNKARQEQVLKRVSKKESEWVSEWVREREKERDLGRRLRQRGWIWNRVHTYSTIFSPK